MGSSNNAQSQNQAAAGQITQNTAQAQAALTNYLQQNPSIMAQLKTAPTPPQQLTGNTPGQNFGGGTMGAQPQQPQRPAGMPQMGAQPAAGAAPQQANMPRVPPAAPQQAGTGAPAMRAGGPGAPTGGTPQLPPGLLALLMPQRPPGT